MTRLISQLTLLACLLASACAFDRAPALDDGDADLGADLSPEEERPEDLSPDLPGEPDAAPDDLDAADPRDLLADLDAPDLAPDAAPDLPPDDAPSPPLSWWERRAQRGLLALTRLIPDGDANIPFDTPGVPSLLVQRGAPIPLRGRGGAALLSPLAASTDQIPDIIQEISSQDAFTLELWLRPHNLAQRGPAPIVWLGAPGRSPNLRVAQQERFLHLTLQTDANAPPLQLTVPAALNGEPLYLALSWSAGELVAWVNGAEVMRRPPEEPLPGLAPPSLRDWDQRAVLGLGAPLDSPQAWLGELYLLALYDRALDAAEVAEHFALGPGPEPTPPQTVSVEIATQAISEEQPGAPAWRLRRRGDTQAPLSLEYRFLGSAEDGEDFQLPDLLYFPPGERERVVSLAPRADGREEGNERALLQLISSGDYALEGAGRASVALRDGGAPPQENLLLWLQGESLDCAPGQSATTWGDNRDPALAVVASGGARCQRDPWAIALDADGAVDVPAPIWREQRRMTLVLVFELSDDDADGAIFTLRRAQDEQSLSVFRERGAVRARIQNFLVREERPLGAAGAGALLTLRVQLGEDGMNFGMHELTLNEQERVALPASPLQLTTWDTLTLGATGDRASAPLRLRELLLYGGAVGDQRLARIFTWVRRQTP